MKKVYLFIIFNICILHLSSQTTQRLTSSHFQFPQDNNAVLVSPFKSNGQNGGLLLPFEAGERSPRTLHFLKYFLAGRLDNGNVQGFFIFGGFYDIYKYGPLYSNGSYSERYDQAFDSLWVISRQDILRYLDDWEDGKIDLVHQAIFGWPARGNTILLPGSVSLPDRELAPFYDRNGNGIYEPMAGEYPSIHGDLTNKPIPRFLSWCVFNTGFSGFKNISFQNISYAYSCEENSILNNNVFFKIKIENYGFEFDTLFTGFHLAGELGCDEDDYWGTDTSSHTVYFYNEEPGITENCLSGGEIHPESHKVTQAFTFLDQKLHAAVDRNVYKHLLGTSVNLDNTPQVFNMMKGLLHTGQAIPYGWGSALQNDSIFSRYLYPDLPTNTGGWHMLNSDMPRYRDWSPWASCNLKDFHDSEELEINFALTTLLDTSESLTNYTVVEKLVDQHIPEIKQYYQSNFSDINCGNSDEFCEFRDCVWPGDANNDQRCFLDDFLYTGWLVKESLNGPERFFQNDQWEPIHSEDWPENFKGKNHKYYDASGDGMIDLKDLEIIKSNFNKKTPYYNLKNWREPQASDVILTVADITFNDYLATASFLRRIRLPVSIKSTSSQGIEDLHSICFTLEYEYPIFDVEYPQNQHLIYHANNKFLNNSSASMAKLHEYELHVAMCEPSDTSYNGEFIVAELPLKLKDGLFDGVAQDSISTPVTLRNVRALRVDGTEIDLAISNGSIIITRSTATKSQYEETQELKLYPNPAIQSIKVKSANASRINSISIYNINLTLKLKIENARAFESKIDVSEFPKGIYIVYLEMENGSHAIGKFIKI